MRPLVAVATGIALYTALPPNISFASAASSSTVQSLYNSLRRPVYALSSRIPSFLSFIRFPAFQRWLYATVISRQKLHTAVRLAGYVGISLACGWLLRWLVEFLRRVDKRWLEHQWAWFVYRWGLFVTGVRMFVLRGRIFVHHVMIITTLVEILLELVRMALYLRWMMMHDEEEDMDSEDEDEGDAEDGDEGMKEMRRMGIREMRRRGITRRGIGWG